MPLTKSLHTITAATNVARRENELLQESPSPERLAKIALWILGYDIDTTIKGDPTVDRIVENCRTLVEGGQKVVTAAA